MNRNQRTSLLSALLAILVVVMTMVGAASDAQACTFCQSVRRTMTDRIGIADVAVIARRQKAKAAAAGSVEEATFQILRILDGEDHLGEVRRFKKHYFGEVADGQKFLVFGSGPAPLMWQSPLLISDRTYEYLKQMLALDANDPERLRIAMKHLEDEEKFLHQDAYDEFAKAPHELVVEIRSSFDANQLVELIENPEVPAPRRGLYFTLLSLCGGEQHLPMLEKQLELAVAKPAVGLDALVNCYLTLSGPDGLNHIEQLLLTEPERDQASRATSAIMALRFLGQQDSAVPRREIIPMMYRMLDDPMLVGQVLPDLARWGDWSALEQAAVMFDKSGEANSWTRQQIIQYLKACPLPEAKQHLVRLAKKNPKLKLELAGQAPPATTMVALREEGSDATGQDDQGSASKSKGALPEGSNLGAGRDASEGKSDRDTDAEAVSLVWIVVFPVAAACVLVLLFWKSRRRED